MSELRVTPLDLRRPIARLRLGDKDIEVFPSAEFARAFNTLLQRNGGSTTDLVGEALTTAQQALTAAQTAALAAVAAYDSGAPPGYALDPAQPVSVQAASSTTASARIVAHTRTPTGMSPISLDAGVVEIPRGVPVTIFYLDPTDAGGAVTYDYTTDAAVAGDYAGGARIVGQAFLAIAGSAYGGAGTP